MRFWVFTIVSLLLSILGSTEQCGRQADDALCPGGLCCSQYGWCGNTNEYCGQGCQSQCDGGGGGDIGEIISRDMFNDLLTQINDDRCEGKGFYSYDAFLTAAEAYPEFGTTGDDATRKREIAAFLAQTSHETAGSGSSSAEQCGRQADGALCPGGLCCSQYGWCGTTDEYCGQGCQSQCDGGGGGWASASADPYSWGYCYVREINRDDYCDPNYPCLGQYYGRGPIQLSWNYNYDQAGRALGVDLISNPDLVATDAVISFKAAIWFWMTAQSPKPSCHDVIIGSWSPSAADTAAGRVPGYGVTTNIINGALECGKGTTNPQVENRIGYFKRYCQVFGTDTGDNLDCYNQTPFGAGLLLDTI